MIQTLNFFPGQKAAIFLETVDGYGTRTDAPTLPAVSRIIFPNLSLAGGYPQNMVKLDTGLYYFTFILPSGAAAIGSYFVDVTFTNPVNNETNSAGYQVIVSAPFGNYSASVAI